VNVADEAPEATDTLEGTEAPVLEERLTIEPPAGAGLASDTVPVAELPPITEFGETLTLASNGV
jgi:hypothetical protein